MTQLFWYVGCVLLGALPLASVYQWLERKIPFHLSPSTASFSWFPLLRGAFIGLEILRGYLIMLIAHEHLLFNWDIVIAVCLFMAARMVSVYFFNQWYLWATLFGVYLFLFSWGGLGFVIVLLFMMIGYQCPLKRVLVSMIAMVGLRFFLGADSLYVSLHISLIGMVIGHYLIHGKLDGNVWKHNNK